MSAVLLAAAGACTTMVGLIAAAMAVAGLRGDPWVDPADVAWVLGIGIALVSILLVLALAPFSVGLL